jgi:hypothetical protein
LYLATLLTSTLILVGIWFIDSLIFLCRNVTHG